MGTTGSKIFNTIHVMAHPRFYILYFVFTLKTKNADKKSYLNTKKFESGQVKTKICLRKK